MTHRGVSDETRQKAVLQLSAPLPGMHRSRLAAEQNRDNFRSLMGEMDSLT